MIFIIYFVDFQTVNIYRFVCLSAVENF